MSNRNENGKDGPTGGLKKCPNNGPKKRPKGGAGKGTRREHAHGPETHEPAQKPQSREPGKPRSDDQGRSKGRGRGRGRNEQGRQAKAPKSKRPMQGRLDPGRQFSHDQFFRLLLGDIRHLAEFLRALLPDLVEELDLEHALAEDTTFVDRATKRHVSDLLWRVPLRQATVPAHIYVLFEHKSAPDRDIFYQVLRMMMQVWGRYRTKRKTKVRKEESQSGSSEPPKHVLPFILPVVVSNQRFHWRLSEDGFRAQFRVSDKMLNWLPTVPIMHVSLPDDLPDLERRIAGRDIDLRAGLKIMTLATRGVDEEGLFDVLQLVAKGSWAAGDRALGSALLQYVTRGKIKIAPERVLELTRKALGTDAEEDMSTFVEYWMNKGIEEGRQEGRELGKAELLLDFLARKFGPVPSEVAEEIHALQNPDAFLELLLRAEQAGSFDEVLVALKSYRQ